MLYNIRYISSNVKSHFYKHRYFTIVIWGKSIIVRDYLECFMPNLIISHSGYFYQMIKILQPTQLLLLPLQPGLISRKHLLTGMGIREHCMLCLLKFIFIDG